MGWSCVGHDALDSLCSGECGQRRLDQRTHVVVSNYEDSFTGVTAHDSRSVTSQYC